MKVTSDISVTGRRPARATWWRAYSRNGIRPLLIADYTRNIYAAPDRTSFEGLHQFVRPSPGWMIDRSGHFVEVAADIPRLTGTLQDGTPSGLLVESESFNALPNNVLAGAAIGPLSQTGRLPDNWTLSGFAPENTRVESITVVDGIPRIQLRFQGVPTASEAYLFLADKTDIATVEGKGWVFSMSASLTAGSAEAFSGLHFYGSGWAQDGSYVSGSPGQFNSPSILPNMTSTLKRFSFLGQLTGATCAFLRPSLRLSSTGGAVDVTLTIALPQVEQRATASSPILTQASGQARAAETVALTGLQPSLYDVVIMRRGKPVVELHSVALDTQYWPAECLDATTQSICLFPADTL